MDMAMAICLDHSPMLCSMLAMTICCACHGYILGHGDGIGMSIGLAIAIYLVIGDWMGMSIGLGMRVQGHRR